MLETDRLLLRAFRASDHAPYAQMCVRPGNQRSIRVAEKLGERFAGEVELLGGKCLVYERRREEPR